MLKVPGPLPVQSLYWTSPQEAPTPCCCSLHRGPAPSTSPSSWQPSQTSCLVSNSERAVAQAQKGCRGELSKLVFLRLCQGPSYLATIGSSVKHSIGTSLENHHRLCQLLLCSADSQLSRAHRAVTSQKLGFRIKLVPSCVAR